MGTDQTRFGGRASMRGRAIVLLVLMALLAPAVTEAALIGSLFVFGDSLSDAGNAAFLSGNTFPPSPPFGPYAEGRFSNGKVAAEYLAERLSIPLAPSKPGTDGTDFAVGGAMTGTGNFNSLVGSPPGLPASFANTGIAEQIGEFAGSFGPGSFDPASSLFMVWGGANDIFFAFARGQDLKVAAGAAAANVAGDVAALASLGAQRFLVVNLPDLGETPDAVAFGPAAQFVLSEASQEFNDQLLSELDLLGIDIDVTLFDALAAQRNILANPAAFGFTNVTSACIADPSALAANCPGFLFFDGVHPTTAGHEILGRQFAAAVPVPATVMLLAAGMAPLLRLRSRSRKTR
jgi:phospholipase/lecithinase/hemolysin